jgi:uncharacterized protein with PQ loop repeat
MATGLWRATSPARHISWRPGDAMNVVSHRGRRCRGDLPRSYWIVGWASTIITTIVVVVVTLLLDPLSGNAGAAVTMSLFWLFRAAVTLWVVVGVWHSWTRDHMGVHSSNPPRRATCPKPTRQRTFATGRLSFPLWRRSGAGHRESSTMLREIASEFEAEAHEVDDKNDL